MPDVPTGLDEAATTPDRLSYTPRCYCGIFLSRDYETRHKHTSTCPDVYDQARRDAGF